MEGRSKGRRFCKVEEEATVVVMIGSLCRLPAALRLAGRSRPSGYFVQQLSQGGPSSSGEGSGSKEAVERLVRAHPVVVFMKGNPAQPQCGFSNAVVQILRLHGVNDYHAYDVLQDPDLRQGRRGPCSAFSSTDWAPQSSRSIQPLAAPFLGPPAFRS